VRSPTLVHELCHLLEVVDVALGLADPIEDRRTFQQIQEVDLPQPARECSMSRTKGSSKFVPAASPQQRAWGNRLRRVCCKVRAEALQYIVLTGDTREISQARAQQRGMRAAKRLQLAGKESGSSATSAATISRRARRRRSKLSAVAAR